MKLINIMVLLLCPHVLYCTVSRPYLRLFYEWGLTTIWLYHHSTTFIQPYTILYWQSPISAMCQWNHWYWWRKIIDQSNWPCYTNL